MKVLGFFVFIRKKVTEVERKQKEQREWLEKYILNPKQSEHMIKLKMEKLQQQDRLRKMLEQIRQNYR